MALRIKDIDEVVNILRDMQAFMYLINTTKDEADELGSRIAHRIDKVLENVE